MLSYKSLGRFFFPDDNRIILMRFHILINHNMDGTITEFDCFCHKIALSMVKNTNSFAFCQ